MPLNRYDQFTIDDKKHERLWKEAMLVFDTSSLLEFYFYSKPTQKKIFDEIFDKVKGRLWIPSHVSYEFQKNRHKVMSKPIGSYKGLETELAKVVKQQKSLETAVSELKSKTKKDDKHPFLDQSLFNSLDKNITSQQEELDKFSEIVKNAINEKIEEIKKSIDNDPLISVLNTHFEVGKGFSFTEIFEIVKEGKTRYEFKIPPGYEDYAKNDSKEGTQIFGDLIIWKEIMQHAKLTQKPVVLISNELKIDWCYRVENQHYIERPKEDLLREFFDFTGVEFWMYSNSQLLYYAKEYLNSAITEEEITEVTAISEQNSTNQKIGCIFTWPVNDETSIGQNPLTKSLMYLTPANGGKILIDWGDGSDLEEFGDINNSVAHDYPDFGIYTVKIFGEIRWFCAMGIGGSTPERWSQYPKIIDLQIENSIYLDRLQCSFGTLDHLNLSGLTALTQLLVSGNQLKNINLANLNHLRLLFCDSNSLNELNVSKNQWISKLNCSRNNLRELDLANLTKLDELDCSYNRMTRLVISKTNLLNKLDCSGNLLSEENLNEIFECLPNANSSEINIKLNVGAAKCNRSIAENKGWIVVEK